MGDDVAKKKFEETKAKAEKGDVAAQTDLGNMYYNGEGLLQDHEKAVEWFRKAAEQGFASGQHRLGVMYAFGKGMRINFVTAYAWANIATFNGDRRASRFKSEFLDVNMAADKIAEGLKLSHEMLKKNPKLIGD